MEIGAELLADGMFRVNDAVEFAHLGRSFLYGAMDRGELAYVKCGRRRLIPKRALVAYLARGLTGRATELNGDGVMPPAGRRA